MAISILSTSTIKNNLPKRQQIWDQVTYPQATYSYTFNGVTGSGGNGSGNGKHYEAYFGGTGSPKVVYASNGSVIATLNVSSFNDLCSPTPTYNSNGGYGPYCEPYRTYTVTITCRVLPAGSYIIHDNGGYGGGTVSLSFDNGGRSVTTTTSQGNGNAYKVVLA